MESGYNFKSSLLRENQPNDKHVTSRSHFQPQRTRPETHSIPWNEYSIPWKECLIVHQVVGPVEILMGLYQPTYNARNDEIS